MWMSEQGKLSSRPVSFPLGSGRLRFASLFACAVGGFLIAPETLADPDLQFDDEEVVLASRADGVDSLRDRQQGLYQCVFESPYDDAMDGVLYMECAPVEGRRILCHRASETCVFEIVQYEAYDRAGLVAEIAEQDPILAAELNASKEWSVGWAEGLLSSEDVSVATAALVVRGRDVRGRLVHVAIPLDPLDRDRFAPVAQFEQCTWVEAEAEPDGAPELPSPSTEHEDEVSDSCSGLLEEGQCAEYAVCECGVGPTCNPQPEFSGIWECMRAADCRYDMCNWAHCTTTFEEVCEGTSRKCYKTRDSFSCAAIHIAEIAICTPIQLFKSSASFEAADTRRTQ